MRRLSLLCLATLLGVALAALPLHSAHAQTLQSSNSTMTVVTSSDAAGGAFSTDGTTGVRARFASQAVQQRVDNAAALVKTQLAHGTLPPHPIATDAPVAFAPTAAHQRVACLLEAQDTVACQVDVAKALAPTSYALAQALSDQLEGLLQDEHVSATQLMRSLHTFNAFVDAAPPDYLAAPPETFVVIRAVLTMLLDASNGS